jgi:hypothetical protein
VFAAITGIINRYNLRLECEAKAVGQAKEIVNFAWYSKKIQRDLFALNLKQIFELTFSLLMQLLF